MDRLQKTYKKVMDGVKKAIERYPQHMVSSLFISISVYFLSNLVAYAKFDSRIDYIQQSVLFNISGNYSPAHTGLIPGMAWYTWLLEVTAFVGVFFLTSVYLFHNESKVSRITAVIFNVFVGYECYMCPGYMKSAIILVLSMSVIVLAYALSDEKKINSFFLPLLGLVIAGLLTKRGFLLGLIMGMFVFITHLSLHRLWNKRACLSMLTFVTATGIVFSLWLINDKVFYENDNLDWNVALTVDDSLEKLDVLGYPDYNEDWQESIGISEDHYNEIW